MRVRTGKPIKVKNLFDYNNSQVQTWLKNILTVGGTAWGNDIFTSASTKAYIYSIFEPSTKYYIWIKATCVQYNGTGKEEASNFANIFWFSDMFTTTDPLYHHYLEYTGDTFETSCVIQTKADPDFSNAAHWYWYTNRYTDGTTNKVKFDFVVLPINEEQGLTKTFYDAHKANFELVADGSNEIVLDSKGGNILSKSVANMYQARTVNAGETGVTGSGWNGTNLATNAYSNHNNYTEVISTFTETGFTVQASNSEFVNGVALEIPFKVDGNCTYKLTYEYEGATSYLDYIQYDSSYTKSSLSVSSGIFTTAANASWIVIRFRAPGGTGAGTVGTYSNVRLVRQSPLTCNVIEKMYGYNQAYQYVDTFLSHFRTGWSEGGFATRTEDTTTQTITLTVVDTTKTVQWFAYMNPDSFQPAGTFSTHKTLLIMDILSTKSLKNLALSYSTPKFSDSTPNEWTQCWIILTNNALNYNYITNGNRQDFEVGDTVSIKNMRCYDLTKWFGAGYEPTSLEEFKEKFTANYYGYCIPIRLTERMINALPEYEYNQQFPTNKFGSTRTTNGITITNNTDGSYTLNGTASARVEFATNQTYNSDHYYYLVGNDILPSGCQIHDYRYRFDKSHSYRQNDGTATNIEIDIASGTTLNNIKVYPQLIDITEWYGAGNEPTTVTEFKATFPHKYYPYMKKSMLNKYQINALGLN